MTITTTEPMGRDEILQTIQFYEAIIADSRLGRIDGSVIPVDVARLTMILGQLRLLSDRVQELEMELSVAQEDIGELKVNAERDRGLLRDHRVRDRDVTSAAEAIMRLFR